MRWYWVFALVAACGADPLDPLPFPGGTAIASDPAMIFEIGGDGTTLVWLTSVGNGTPSSLFRLRDGETEPTQLYAVPYSGQAGGLVLVNHQPYFQMLVGELLPSIFTVDDSGALIEAIRASSLFGGQGAFLAHSIANQVTIADPRTGPERDPWQLTFTPDNGTYVYGAGKLVHNFYAGNGGETIELGTGARELLTYPHHDPLVLVPAEHGFFFYETGLGLFHATSDGTTQLTSDPGFASFVAVGDELWLAITTSGQLGPTTGLAHIRPDGSAEVRQLQADTAMVFRSGSQLMAVTYSVNTGSTIWRVDD